MSTRTRTTGTRSARTKSEGTGRRAGLDRDEVIQRALDMVEARGPDSLTMRALASELGVTTTTIYWHVGGRDELLTAIVERLAHKQAQQMIIGNSPGERIRSIAETIWANALAHRNVTALAHRTGTTNLLERPMKLAILRELEAAGVGGQEAISALQAVILCTAGFLVVAFRDGVEMEERGDLHATFTRTISAIVREFVPEPEAAGRDNHRPPETDTGDPDEPTQDMR